MTTTQNTYAYPVQITQRVTITYDASPAHVGGVVDVKQDSNVGGEDKSYDTQGNYIEIQHAKNEYSIYEHIRQQGSLVKIGDKVKTGQIIGYSGKTGWIAHLGPHLHFDVHIYLSNNPEDYQTLKIHWKE